MIEPKPIDPNQPAPSTDRLAQAAVEPIVSGMVVGLGTGRTADRAVRALARRMREHKLDIDCVCCSVATEQLALELGLPTVPFNEVESVDFLVDGAVEVDHQLRMLKGQQGAITRQRLVASVSKRNVYIVASEERYVPRFGANSPLTIVIIPFGTASIRNRLRDMGLSGVIRRNLDGDIHVTDGGGVIIDARFPERDAEELAIELDHVTGVVDHGIFIDEADEVLVECKSGEIKRLTRPV
ncbi:MAG: ribose 5-phosphate isomerase A [Phycisphaerales bacterium]|nr:ribose 5-phosphate isomerase A [Phycisphaerales bacterium]